MKLKLCTSLAVALTILACVAATPLQKARPATVLPPPPCPIGEPHAGAATGEIICTNSEGQTVKLELGTANANEIGSVDAAGNTKGRQITTSGMHPLPLKYYAV